jgi:putative endonuclease
MTGCRNSCEEFLMADFYVYIMSNPSRTLYTGVTNDLERRVAEHKQGDTKGFTSRYQLNMLVWYDTLPDAAQAIETEKRIKTWRRSKKIALFETMNPLWLDLAENWNQ